MRREKKILIIGGGFAGARAAQELSKAGFDDVTLVDRKDYFEVTYATLRILAAPDVVTANGRIDYADFVRGKFRQDEVTSLTDRSAILTDGTILEFDIAVIATGSSYQNFPIAKTQNALSIQSRRSELELAQQRLVDSQNVLIIGGGPVGVELAGEIAYQHPSKNVSVTEGSKRLLRELKPKAGRIAEELLKSLGVNVVHNTILSPTDAAYQAADIVYTCVGASPNSSLMEANFGAILDDKKRIKVDDKMRIEGYEHLFSIGDCANIPEGKLGFLADIQAQALAKNIIAATKGKALKAYKPASMSALVPVGQRKGVAQTPFGVTKLGLIVGMKQKDLFVSKQFQNLDIVTAPKT